MASIKEHLTGRVDRAELAWHEALHVATACKDHLDTARHDLAQYKLGKSRWDAQEEARHNLKDLIEACESRDATLVHAALARIKKEGL